MSNNLKDNKTIPMDTPSVQQLQEPAGWIQIQAGSELSELVRLIRLGNVVEGAGFLHSDYSAQQLLWRWFLKWYPQAALSSASQSHEQEDKLISKQEVSYHSHKPEPPSQEQKPELKSEAERDLPEQYRKYPEPSLERQDEETQQEH